MNIFFIYILLGALVAAPLFIWFNTNAFVEYMSLFGLGGLGKINEYKQATVDDPATTYPDYINANYNSFLTRLVGCPKCLGVQFSILANIILFILTHQSLYIWFLLPFSVSITVYFALLLYFLLVKMIKT